MGTPKVHVEEIRKTKFSIGREEANPLTEDLHQAVKNLSAELYAKDVHFLMELIQNAEDNEYPEGVNPSLEFVITSRDITAVGAFHHLQCWAFPQERQQELRLHWGESNGYQIRFSEEPCVHCNVGYIVPEWADKVEAVKQQLSSMHPEILLFLSRIKRLSVREDNVDPRHNTVSAIAISSETNFVTRKNIDAESYTLHLSAKENGYKFDAECGYYMWKQKFPVRRECRVDKINDVDEWMITLAFPIGEHFCRGTNTSPGVYAFLPTEMVTNFPFIIEADFLLASSRETILLDSKWNKGILDCIPTAFLNAFISLVRSKEDAPVSSLTRMVKFLPVQSSYEGLNVVSDGSWQKVTLNGSPGFRPPSQSFLLKSSSGNLLQNSSVFVDIPLIDQSHYDGKINDYKEELKKIGVRFEFGEACEYMGKHLMSLAAASSLTRGNVFSVLRFIRFLREKLLPPDDFISSIKDGQWLKTSLGFRSLVGSVLSDDEWTVASQISDIPFIDEAFYGKEEICQFKTELELLGVAVSFSKCYQLIIDNLKSHSCLTSWTPEVLLLMLKCMCLSSSLFQAACMHLRLPFQKKMLHQFSCYRTLNVTPFKFPADFKSCIREVKWLRSRLGDYRSPKQCILSGPEGKLSRAWLKTHVGYHSPDQCLLFDSKSRLKQTDGPFIDEEFYGSKITTYRKELAAIGVIVEVKKGGALIARHLDLHDEFSTFVRVYSYLSDSKWVPLADGEAPGRIWVLKENKIWESSESGLSHDQCCMFWLYVSKHWNLKMEKSLADAVVKVPVYSGSGGILLCNKEDVFIADDLHLQYLYKQKVESSLADDVELLMIPTKKLMGKTLLRLILGFLAGPPIEMEVEKRQKAVQGLVDIAVVETPEPIIVSYDLPLSSGEVLNVKGTRKIRWDRENSKFFIQKMDKSGGQKSTIEFATYFAEAISECVLWECTEHIPALSELIKLAFVLEFNEEAVDFLMKLKNLQIFVEDGEFLNSAYPSI
ncbi:hypothetical protein ACFX10_038509 [Malus domestica]